MRNVDALRRQAETAGPVIGRYAAALLDSPLPWTRMRRVYALLGLVRRYGAARVTEVCTIALGPDMLDVHRLKRMLEQGVVAPPAAPPGRVIAMPRYLRPATPYKLPLGAAAEREESQ
ncbi:MAG: transposase [Acidobacteria bacterium]|nr:transposase [Acidobacteriota bacterium]